jgi:hypothetical protein
MPELRRVYAIPNRVSVALGHSLLVSGARTWTWPGGDSYLKSSLSVDEIVECLKICKGNFDWEILTRMEHGRFQRLLRR